MSFSWLVVKKVNKFCSTKEHCLTSKHVSVSATFQIMQTFRLLQCKNIVYTTKKYFSPDAANMVENIVANPTVI